MLCYPPRFSSFISWKGLIGRFQEFRYGKSCDSILFIGSDIWHASLHFRRPGTHLLEGFMPSRRHFVAYFENVVFCLRHLDLDIRPDIALL